VTARRIGWIAGTCVFFLAAAAQPATAHTEVYPTSLTIGVGSAGSGPDEETVWFGNAISEKPACQPDRKVKLFRDPPSVAPPSLIGSDITNAEGYWQINMAGYPPPDGVYYAKTRGRVLSKNDRHRHTCSRARSDELAVPGPGIDYDGDGYFIVHGDCDDEDPTVNPGATEIANGKDDNCDGQADEGV
jgi:hypothetical protein